MRLVKVTKINQITEEPPVIISYNNLTDKPNLEAKQDILVSGTNIKTINSQSLLGNGDIPITGGTDSSNSYTPSGW